MTSHVLVLRYACFALIATAANLLTQRLVLNLGGSSGYFVVAIGAGTAIGLVIKYTLDKHWIFQDNEGGISAHSRKFSLYTAMGLVTTAIFWGSETLFWWLWRSDLMREVGAVLGLAMGYVAKYHLDKRYVFANSPIVRTCP